MLFIKQNIYPIIFAFLIVSYLLFSVTIYLYGSGNYQMKTNEKALAGQQIWQQKNCQACHQIYGLGGYMGPDLTNATSEKGKGEEYMKMVLQTGTIRMPRFNLSNEQIDEVIAFLKHVNNSGNSIVNPEQIDIFGNYTLAENKHE
jgi:nitric oxide reductase subunit C